MSLIKNGGKPALSAQIVSLQQIGQFTQTAIINLLCYPQRVAAKELCRFGAGSRSQVHSGQLMQDDIGDHCQLRFKLGVYVNGKAMLRTGSPRQGMGEFPRQQGAGVELHFTGMPNMCRVGQ